MLYIIPCALHLTGIYLLYYSRRFHQVGRNQYLYVLNLSIVEFIYCLVFVCANAVSGEHEQYLKMFRQSFMYTWFSLIMICLTLDRFLEIYLNLRYVTICTVYKTKIALCLAPVFSIGISVVVYLVANNNNDMNLFKSFDRIINLFYCPILNVIFMTTAIVTYGYILRKIRRVRRRSSIADDFMQNVSKRKRFLRKIYMPTFLVVTFFLFYLVPDFVNWIYKFYGIIESDQLQNVHYLAHWVSYVSDALIYTLATKQIRKTIKRMMYKRLQNKESSFSENSAASTRF